MYAKNGVGMTPETLWPQEDVTAILRYKFNTPNNTLRYQIVKIYPSKRPSLLD
jgi:hypothetical protein